MLTTFKGAGKNASIQGVFFGYFEILIGAPGVEDARQVHEIGGGGRLGLEKNLGPPQHNVNHFQRCWGKCVCLGAVFWSF